MPTRCRAYGASSGLTLAGDLTYTPKLGSYTTFVITQP